MAHGHSRNYTTLTDATPLLPNFAHPTILIWWIIFTGCVGCATWKGGGPERAVAAFAVYMVVVQGFALALAPPEFYEVDETALLADSILTVGVLGVALSANRVWPLPAAAFCLFSLGAHLSRAAAPEIIGYAYSVTKAFPTLVAVLFAAIGAFRHEARKKVHGKYRDWRVWDYLEYRHYEVSHYSVEWRLAKSRSWVEIPTMICGGMVLIFCIAWGAQAVNLALEGQDPWLTINSYGLAIVTALGAGALGFGWWWHKREEGLANFREIEFIKTFDPKAISGGGAVH
jgi:hypothetical protein